MVRPDRDRRRAPDIAHMAVVDIRVTAAMASQTPRHHSHDSRAGQSPFQHARSAELPPQPHNVGRSISSATGPFGSLVGNSIASELPSGRHPPEFGGSIGWELPYRRHRPEFPQRPSRRPVLRI
jgi:hypothetical protein